MKLKILLADDDPEFCGNCKLVWEKEEGIDVVARTDPGEALSEIEKKDYDAIVADYKMPEMNGLELLKILREKKEKNIPFIILTGKGNEEVAKKALDFNADKYLMKGKSPKNYLEEILETIFESPVA